jgi:hypothetical protein
MRALGGAGIFMGGNMATQFKLKRWQDQVILLLGLWLIVSPWALGYAEGTPQMINVLASGLVIAVLAAFDLYKTYFWAVVVNLLVGAAPRRPGPHPVELPDRRYRRGGAGPVGTAHRSRAAQALAGQGGVKTNPATAMPGGDCFDALNYKA